MGKLRLPVLLVAVFVSLTAAARADELDALEKQLNSSYVGKVATLRKFYLSDSLHFDPDGNLRDDRQVGPWTIYGKVEIQGIHLSKRKLEIQANRLLVTYEEGRGWVYRRGWPIRIEFALPSPNPKIETVAVLFSKAFLTSEDKFSDFVPPYWRQFLLREETSTDENPSASGREAEPSKTTRGDSSKSGAKPEEVANEQPKRLQVSSGVQEGKRIHFAEPDYPEVAKQARIQGWVQLQAVISKEGSIKDLQIVRAVGAGLDDAAVEAVRQWKYKPTLLMGEPVEVITIINVVYRLR